MIRNRRLLSVILVALSGCTTAESPSTSPSATGETVSSAPSGSASDESEPSPSAPSATDEDFLIVVSEELRMRTAAGVGAELVGVLTHGSILRVESGPVDADGYTWLEVTDLSGRRGWAASGDTTDAWVEPIPDATSGMPILTLQYGCEMTPPINPPATSVMDDRWVLTTLEGGMGSGWLVRRLSTSGLDEIREDVLGSPYLQASASYEPQRLPGAEPPGHGACLFRFTVSTSGEPIVVESVSWFGDEEEGEFYVPSPERKALDGLARNLIAIDEVLADEAWESAGLPYVAAEYVITLVDGPGPAPEGTPAVDPATLGLGDLAEFGDPSGLGRCGVVTRDVAFEFARVINLAAPDTVRLDNLIYLNFLTDRGWTSATIAPRFPGGESDCAARE